MILRLITSGSIGLLPFAVRTYQTTLPPVDNTIAFIGVLLAIAAAMTALITAASTARNSATKLVVDELRQSITDLRGDLKITRADLEQTRTELAETKEKYELSEAALSYLVSTFHTQHLAEVNYALAIRAGDQDGHGPHATGNDSDPAMRAAKRRKE